MRLGEVGQPLAGSGARGGAARARVRPGRPVRLGAGRSRGARRAGAAGQRRGGAAARPGSVRGALVLRAGCRRRLPGEAAVGAGSGPARTRVLVTEARGPGRAPGRGLPAHPASAVRPRDPPGPCGICQRVGASDSAGRRFLSPGPAASALRVLRLFVCAGTRAGRGRSPWFDALALAGSVGRGPWCWTRGRRPTSRIHMSWVRVLGARGAGRSSLSVMDCGSIPTSPPHQLQIQILRAWAKHPKHLQSPSALRPQKRGLKSSGSRVPALLSQVLAAGCAGVRALVL